MAILRRRLDILETFLYWSFRLSTVVVRHLENMFIVIAFTKIYPACQTDENGIKPGSNFHTVDKSVADPSQDEYLGIKQSVFDVRLTHTKKHVLKSQSSW